MQLLKTWAPWPMWCGLLIGLAGCSPMPAAPPTLPRVSAPAPVPGTAASAASAPTSAVPEVALPAAAPSVPAVQPAAPYGAAVAARFPDPPVTYATPAFQDARSGFTTNAELQALLRALVRPGEAAGLPGITLLALGSSQNGVPIEALLFSRVGDAAQRATRPTVLLVGQQHGDEPAGSEALLVIAQELAQGSLMRLLDRINVIVLPRANPDGAQANRRVTASGVDANRDHLLLRTPEAQAQAQLVREYQPAVVVDAHEYTVVGRYLEKFGTVQRFDALLQYAMTANMPPFISKAAEEWFREPLRASLTAQGLTSEWYYTTSTDLQEKKISMGGTQPDTGRNVNGLKNAVSILLETRGVGIGRLHLKRRVHTHVTAMRSVLQSTHARAADLMKLRHFVDNDVSLQACRGEVVVEAAPTPSEYNLVMLDPVTGADRTLAVAWDSALELQTVKARARPCGYWLAADQVDAVARLRRLGVQVRQVSETGVARGETYTETSREEGARQDVRGTIADAAPLLRLQVQMVPALIDVPAGSFYVPLEQPLANLVVAALEPDTQNSYVAHRIVNDLAAQARVLARPEMKSVAVP
jgi:hypothetical protein